MECIQCKQNFEIREQDRAFYSKFDFPEPKMCPQCRDQRRFAFTNDFTLYTRSCDLCKKSIISIYPAQTPYTVFCTQCWYGDGWDVMKYGMEFNFKKPFFEQFQDLQIAVPRISLTVTNCETSPYVNNCGDMAKCYMCASSGYSEECFYQMWVEHQRNCSDCLRAQNNELCYEIVDTFGSYNSGWLLKCDNMIDSYFCFDSKGCTKCILCSNLKNKTLYIMNKPADEQTYKNFVERMGSFKEAQELKKQWKHMIKGAIHKFALLVNSPNSVGDNLRNAVGCFSVFDCEEIQNVHYTSYTFKANDSWDISCYGDKCEFCYEGHGIGGGVSKLFFCNQCGTGSSDLIYCDMCEAAIGCFGSDGLRKKMNCILNKQYSKEEYAALKQKIIRHMKETGEWGQFFPPKLSPFGYNETLSFLYYPLAKEDAVKYGFKWVDNLPETKGKETLTADNIPDRIGDAGDDLCKQILACSQCGRNYKVIAQELALLKKIKVPVPRLCHMCRLKERMNMRNPARLFSGECKCTFKNHSHEGKCTVKFDTAFAKDREEKVFCEACYLKETG